MIRAVQENFSGRVIANGGVRSPEDARQLLERTKAHGLGIARGALGHPWIFRQTHEFLLSGTYKHATMQTVASNALQHATFVYALKGTRGIIELRKHLAWYIRGIPHAAELRHQLVQCSSISDVRRVLTQLETSCK
jgi:tRNA-dihydrouridine synthase B